MCPLLRRRALACSLRGGEGRTLRDSSGEDWAVAVHVVNLGSKPLSKIAFWAEQDRKLADDARLMLAYLRDR